MKIYAPVKDFNGWRGNVRFVNGVGETDNPRLIEWFLSHGYTIAGADCLDYLETIVPPKEEVPIKETASADENAEPDFESMTPNELRDWAKEHGLGSVIKNTRNKEKLLELIRG